MTEERVARYQALLGENPQIQAEAMRTLNPTTKCHRETEETMIV
jgi:hypothetical protein